MNKILSSFTSDSEDIPVVPLYPVIVGNIGPRIFLLGVQWLGFGFVLKLNF